MKRPSASKRFSEWFVGLLDKIAKKESKSDSTWKIFPIGQGSEQVEPLRVCEVETTPLLGKLFLYVKPYGKFYCLKFL